MRMKTRLHAMGMIAGSLILLLGLGAVELHANKIEDVNQVVASYHHALATKNTEAALALLAEDLMVLESGHVENLEEYKSHHLGADMEFSAAMESERTVLQTVIEGDVAWIVSSSTSKGTFRGREIDAIGVETMVLARTDSGWLIRSIHWSSRSR